MKLKAFTLLLVLFSTNCDLAIKANNNVKENNIILKEIVIKQLTKTLLTLDTDYNSISLINKYRLIGNFTALNRIEIRNLTKRLNIEEEWLYQLFYLESRGNPKAVNSKSKATGLIQFMPTTAKNLGTSSEALYHMSISNQLVYVEKYLLRVINNRPIDNFLELYLAVFYPYALGKPLAYVLGSEISQSRSNLIYRQNKGIDHQGNKDYLISKRDLLSWVS